MYMHLQHVSTSFQFHVGKRKKKIYTTIYGKN